MIIPRNWLFYFLTIFLNQIELQHTFLLSPYLLSQILHIAVSCICCMDSNVFYPSFSSSCSSPSPPLYAGVFGCNVSFLLNNVFASTFRTSIIETISITFINRLPFSIALNSCVENPAFFAIAASILVFPLYVCYTIFASSI